MFNNIAIIGGSGAIGNALINQLAKCAPGAVIHTFSRAASGVDCKNVRCHLMNYAEEASIEAGVLQASKEAPLDLVMVATGVLHASNIMPEKSLQDLSAETIRYLFEINTILPAMLAKHFIPKLKKDTRSIFAALSARVGSISDNRLGGWYSYRASKAALNMIIKTAAIETVRSNKNAIVVGLHPGTVDSKLSKPFQAHVPNGKLFTPEFSASKLLEVLQALTPEDSGQCFAWDGGKINP